MGSSSCPTGFDCVSGSGNKCISNRARSKIYPLLLFQLVIRGDAAARKESNNACSGDIKRVGVYFRSAVEEELSRILRGNDRK